MFRKSDSVRIRIVAFGYSCDFYQLQSKSWFFWWSIPSYNISRREWCNYTFGRWGEMVALGLSLKDPEALVKYNAHQIDLATEFPPKKKTKSRFSNFKREL